MLKCIWNDLILYFRNFSWPVSTAVCNYWDLSCLCQLNRVLLIVITNTEHTLFQPLFGHGGKEPVTYQQTSNGELFCIDDTEVNVVAMATAEENIPQLASPSVNGSFLLVCPVTELLLSTLPYRTALFWCLFVCLFVFLCAWSFSILNFNTMAISAHTHS